MNGVAVAMTDQPDERALRWLASPLRRTADLIVSAGAVLLLAPVLVIVAFLVLTLDGRPVLFRQERIGRYGEPFPLYKFRTMRSAEDSVGSLLDSGARTTRLGELLRRTSIDELPGLWSILAGPMSVVGPRPLLALHVPLYEHTHPERLIARPGLTGLAQIMGRKDLTFRERLDLDVAYVRSAGPSRDVTIVLRTFLAVIRGLGRPSEGQIEEVDDIGLADAIRSAAVKPRWEHGSFLQPHGAVGSEAQRSRSAGAPGAPGVPEDPRHGGVVFGTARQALIALAGGATRIHLPAYYCPDVVRALHATFDGRVIEYPDDPLAGPTTVSTAQDDLVVVLPHFGRPTQVRVEGGRLAIDATHSLGRAGLGLTTDASGRDADVCFASLRKTLPLPDGALVWSPSGGALPEAAQLHPAHEAAALRVEAALHAKVALLDGERDDKPEVLRELTDAVAAMEAITVPSAALGTTLGRLRTFDLSARWTARETNRMAAAARLDRLGVLADGRLRILDAPFMLVLIADSHAARERLRTGLIVRDVYPAVLWSHDHLPAGTAERDLGERLLALHVDARYGPSDVERVADHVHQVWSGQPDDR